MGDVLTSALGHDGPAQAMVPLLLSGHSSRIVYEGRLLLTSRDQAVAVPDLVGLLPSEEHPSIALARHATKMLDNQIRKGKSVDEFESEIHDAWMSQRERLREGVRPGFEWMQPDLGFYTLGDAVVGATIPLHLRFGLTDVQPTRYPEHFRQFGKDMIASLTVYSYLSGDTSAISAGLDVSRIDTVENNDRFVQRYMKWRYDRAFNVDQRLLLLLIESEVNIAATLVPLLTGAHVMSAFRARLVSLWHALSSLSRILDACPDAVSPATEQVRTLVKSPRAQTLAGDGMRDLRNRCVHYEIRSNVDIEFTDAPMYGIIESLTGQTFESVDELVRELSAELSEALRFWRER